MPKVYLSESDRIKSRLSTWVIGTMKQKHLTQKQLGEEVGIKQQTLSKKLSNNTLTFGDFTGLVRVLKPDKETLYWLLDYKE